MKALLWKGYGVSDIYILNDHNFEIVKTTVLQIMNSYELCDIEEIQDTNFWGEFVDFVREATYGDDSFELFEIVEVNK